MSRRRQSQRAAAAGRQSGRHRRWRAAAGAATRARARAWWASWMAQRPSGRAASASRGTSARRQRVLRPSTRTHTCSRASCSTTLPTTARTACWWRPTRAASTSRMSSSRRSRGRRRSSRPRRTRSPSRRRRRSSSSGGSTGRSPRRSCSGRMPPRSTGGCARGWTRPSRRAPRVRRHLLERLCIDELVQRPEALRVPLPQRSDRVLGRVHLPPERRGGLRGRAGRAPLRPRRRALRTATQRLAPLSRTRGAAASARRPAGLNPRNSPSCPDTNGAARPGHTLRHRPRRPPPGRREVPPRPLHQADPRQGPAPERTARCDRSGRESRARSHRGARASRRACRAPLRPPCAWGVQLPPDSFISQSRH